MQANSLKNVVDFVSNLSPDIQRLLNNQLPPLKGESLEWSLITCKHGVPNVYRIHEERPKYKKLKCDSAKEQILKVLRKYGFWNITDSLRKEVLNILSSKIIVLYARMANGEERIFIGKQRGTTAYNKYYSARIIDRLKVFTELKLETCALTVTCDVKEFMGKPQPAWEVYAERLNRLLKQIARTYPCEYVRVIEATRRGFPHAHIVLAFKPGTVKDYILTPNQGQIRDRDLHKYIQRFLPARVYHFEKIEGQNTAYYLAKYISKHSTTDLFSLKDKDGSLSESERKVIDCLMFLTAVGARQFTMSRGTKCLKWFSKSKKPREENVAAAACNDQTDDPPADCPPSERSSSAQRYFLIRQWNNLPACLKSRVLGMSLNQKLRLFGEESGRLLAEDYQKLQKFKKNCNPLGCPGCIWSHLFNFIMGNDDFVINPYFSYEDGSYQRLFDNVDMLDDEQFMAGLKNSLFILLHCIKNLGVTLTQYAEMAAKPFGIQVCNGKIVFEDAKNYTWDSWGVYNYHFHRALGA